MHFFFRDVRVYKRKEFFATSADEIHRFFDMIVSNGGDPDERQQWALALAKASPQE